MIIKQISIQNYRSIKNVENIVFESLQAFIGENNAGKSNILSAIECFLSSGAAAKTEDFNDIGQPIIVKITFCDLSDASKNVWKPYLINNELTLEKHIVANTVSNSGKAKITGQFHGYKAEPQSWFLSLSKIEEEKGARPNWMQIVEENDLPEYFVENGRSSKAIFRKALEKYLLENEVGYDEPDLSETQALGLSAVAVSSLPKFYLLKAVTDYSTEINKNSSSTTFRRLMGDLSERILKKDARYQQIVTAITTIENLLNEETKGSNGEEIEPVERLQALSVIEGKIKDLLSNLMPSVQKVKLRVATENIKTIFSKGVELLVDDGVETDVLLKGHGLQRCIVFSLLQTLIYNERNQLIEGEEQNQFPLILAIEEPELYIHPQIRKLFYDVLVDFSGNDQVIYCTHSTQFIDINRYENIAIVKKNATDGTQISNCDLTAFNGINDDEKKMYKMFQKFNSEVNELFFAKHVILVEGIQDKIAITETLIKREKIRYRSEELEISIVIASGKDNIPAIARVLNAFRINYVTLFDLDIKEGDSDHKVASNQRSTDKICEIVAGGRIVTFPISLESSAGTFGTNHFSDTFRAYSFFSDHTNISTELEAVIDSVMAKFPNT